MGANLKYYNIFSLKVKHFQQNDTIPQLFIKNTRKYYVNLLSKYVVFYRQDAQDMAKR